MTAKITKKAQGRGKLIVFEGPDGAGKKTQSKFLVKYLESIGINSYYIEFPQYNTPFGRLVAKYLRGEFGEKEAIPPEIPAILYAVDRYQFMDDIEDKLRQGVYVVANRYSESNLGYQAAKLRGKAKADFIKWLECLEGRLPKADLVVYLHLPVAEAQKLIANRSGKKYLKGKQKDIHEIDIDYQKRVDRTYLEVARKDPKRWRVVNCASKGSIKSKNSIHKEIIAIINKKFKLV